MASPRSWLMASILLLVGCGSERSSSGESIGGGGGDAGGGQAGAVDAGLLDFPCAPGELDVQGVCLPAGIAAEDCPEGFDAIEHAGCAPVLPPADCLPGQIALPGETSCRAVAPCGATPWAGIPLEVDSQYVDQSFAGLSDGSAAAPWLTIGEAVAAAVPNAVVAVAPGVYLENVVVDDKVVRIWGKCPDEVTIEATNDVAAVYFQKGADQSELHRVRTKANSSVGVLVENAVDVLVDEVWIHDGQWIGAFIYRGVNDQASMTLRRSLIEGNVASGIVALGATLVVEDSEIRGVLSTAQGEDGNGIFADAAEGVDPRPHVTVTRSILHDLRRTGMLLVGGDFELAGVAIADVAPEQDATDGAGILALSGDGGAPVLSIDGVSVERVGVAGVFVRGGVVNARRVTVRAVRLPAGENVGAGFAATAAPDAGLIDVTASEVSVAEVDHVGFGIASADAAISRVIVHDVTASDVDVVSGLGISVEVALSGLEGVADVEAVVIDGVETVGLGITGSHSDLRSIAITDVAPHPISGIGGRGLAIERVLMLPGVESSARVEHCAIRDVHEAAITVLGTEASISSCAISDVALPSVSTVGAQFATGILVQQSIESGDRASADIDHVVVERATTAGIIVAVADARVHASVVRDIGGDAQFGDGIVSLGEVFEQGTSVVHRPSSVVVTQSSVHDVARAGLSVFWGSLTVGSSELLCNAIALNGESSTLGVPFDLVDDGGNRCGCDGELTVCKVLSSMLGPPPVAE
jgi:hypothetical protein